MPPQNLTAGIKEATDAGRQKELLSSARLALRIFFSMNNPGLTEVCVLLPHMLYPQNLQHNCIRPWPQ